MVDNTINDKDKDLNSIKVLNVKGKWEDFSFVKSFFGEVEGLVLKHEESSDPMLLECGNIVCHGNPTEKYTKVLSKLFLASGQNVNSAAIRLEFFISQNCPFCMKAFEIVSKIYENHCFKLDIFVVDHVFSDAESRNIKQVPSLIFYMNDEEKSRLSGTFGYDDIEALVNVKKLSLFPASYFSNILEQGDAEKLAEDIVLSQTIPSGFMALVKSEKLTDRLGSIVCMEYIKDLDQKFFNRILDLLWEGVNSFSESVKGDFFYLVSQSDEKEVWMKRLKSELKNKNSDNVNAAIKESLDNLLIEK